MPPLVLGWVALTGEQLFKFVGRLMNDRNSCIQQVLTTATGLAAVKGTGEW